MVESKKEKIMELVNEEEFEKGLYGSVSECVSALNERPFLCNAKALIEMLNCASDLPIINILPDLNSKARNVFKYACKRENPFLWDDLEMVERQNREESNPLLATLKVLDAVE